MIDLYAMDEDTLQALLESMNMRGLQAANFTAAAIAYVAQDDHALAERARVVAVMVQAEVERRTAAQAGWSSPRGTS